MAVYSVSNNAELMAALTRASGGDTISLAPGNYSNVVIRDYRPETLVIIKSADLNNPAHIDTLQVRSSQNLTFAGLDIGRALLPGEPDHTAMATVRTSSRIVFDTVKIHGSLDGNAQNDGFGLLADSVNAFAVINSKFEQLSKGLAVSQITNLQISNNRFDDMRSDGLNVSASRNAVVEGNIFQGFYPLALDHPDAMQFFNASYAGGTADVTIRNNVLLPGGSYGPQGIWIADPGAGGFQNFTIENNMLWSEGSYNGIGIFGMAGASVIGNTILSPTADTKTFWIRLKDSSNIDLIDNVAEDFLIETNVTNVRSTNNMNLRLTPSARLEMTDFTHPQSASDVILPGVGVQLRPANPGAAPISSAIGGSLQGMLGAKVGDALGSIRVEANDLDQIDLSMNSSSVVAPETYDQAHLPGKYIAASDFPVGETFFATNLIQGSTMHPFINQDWYTALP